MRDDGIQPTAPSDLDLGNLTEDQKYRIALKEWLHEWSTKTSIKNVCDLLDLALSTLIRQLRSDSPMFTDDYSLHVESRVRNLLQTRISTGAPIVIDELAIPIPPGFDFANPEDTQQHANKEGIHNDE